MTVRLRCSSWSQLAQLHRRDLSRGQIFLRTKKAPKPGTPLHLHLGLPSGSVVELDGVVSVVLGEDSNRGSGAVVALEPLAPAHRLTLESALKALTEQTRRVTARRDPIPAPKLAPPTPAPPTPEPAAAKSLATADTLSFDQGRELAAADDELTAALRTELATFAKLNSFQVLGVGYEASDDDIRGAFGELSKRYHPDRFVRYQSEVISQLAEELFVRARDAYKKTATTALRTALREQIARERTPRKPPPPELLKLTGRGRSATVTAPQRPSALSGGEGGLDIPPPRLENLGDAPTETPSGTSLPAAAFVPSASAPTRHLGGDKLRPGAAAQARPAPPKAPVKPELDPLIAYPDAEDLLERKRFTDAAGLFNMAARRDGDSDAARAGLELAEALRALEAGDRLEAAQRFEAVLDLHPANEVAARELAKMRRRVTDQRKGLLVKLMKDQG